MWESSVLNVCEVGVRWSTEGEVKEHECLPTYRGAEKW